MNREMRRDMALAVRDLIGSGYVSDYYYSLAIDFYEIAVAHGASDKDRRDARVEGNR